MIVRLTAAIDDGLYAAGECLIVPGGVGHAFIQGGKAVPANEAAAEAVPYEPDTRRAARATRRPEPHCPSCSCFQEKALEAAPANKSAARRWGRK